MRNGIRETLLLSLLALGLCICQTAGYAHAAGFTVAAAADLSSAFPEIGNIFEKKTGITPVFSFGSSGMLARQIEGGAPFDLYASADMGFLGGLRAKGLIVAGSVKPYAVGSIGLATRKGSGIVVRTVADLKSPVIKKIAIANPAHAPYGRAAKEALESAGVWEAVKDKVVFGENIRQALQFVATGNAEVGITALSLHDPKEMDFILISPALHRPILQGIGIVASSSDKNAARAFIDVLTSPEGRAILERYGFGKP